jgi:hypothetical protein
MGQRVDTTNRSVGRRMNPALGGLRATKSNELD